MIFVEEQTEIRLRYFQHSHPNSVNSQHCERKFLFSLTYQDHLVATSLQLSQAR